jgi:hypothetical protein
LHREAEIVLRLPLPLHHYHDFVKQNLLELNHQFFHYFMRQPLWQLNGMNSGMTAADMKLSAAAFQNVQKLPADWAALR